MDATRITRRNFARVLAGGAAIAVAGHRRVAAGEGPDGNGRFAFGVIADAQYCDAKPAGTRYYRASQKKLADCVEAFNALDLAFVIHLGDFIDRDFASYDVMVPIYDRLEAPHYHVLGNHDFSVAPDKIDEVPAKLGLKQRHYAFRTNGWRFVALDGNDLSLIGRRKGSREYEKSEALYQALKQQNAPNAQTWNGGLGKGQLAWLDRQLAEADKSGEKVVVFCHYPVYPENVHNLWNAAEVIRVLDSHTCVAAYMNGHNHAGNYAQHNGIHYVTYPGMVETRDTTAYAVVQVHPGGLNIAGHGRTRTRTLEYR